MSNDQITPNPDGSYSIYDPEMQETYTYGICPNRINQIEAVSDNAQICRVDGTEAVNPDVWELHCPTDMMQECAAKGSRRER